MLDLAELDTMRPEALVGVHGLEAAHGPVRRLPVGSGSRCSTACTASTPCWA